METENQSRPDPMIYDSLEALADYLSQVRLRLEQRQRSRLEVERLCTSITRVKEELDAAHQAGDTEIGVELQGVLQEFESRLTAIQTASFQTASFQTVLEAVAMSGVEPIATAAPLPHEPSTTREIESKKADREPADKKTADKKTDVAIPACLVSTPLATEDQPQESPPVVHAVVSTVLVPVVSNEEREARKHAWLTEIEAIAARWTELDREGLRLKEKLLNRPVCLRMRALACALAKIQTQADLAGLHSHVIKGVTALRDRMDLARVYAGDTFDALPFDSVFWTGDAARLEVEDWAELSDLYEAVAAAQEAWDWYARAPEAYRSANQHALLNAIGALQQMLFRALEEYGGSDKLQGDLFGSLREAAGTVGFLSSLNAETSWAELQEMGRTLPRLYAQAKREAVIAQEKSEKEARKTAALQAILHWQQESDSQAVHGASPAKSRAKLLPLLDACIAAGIPATHVQVRGALLNVAPVLLKDLPQYGKFLEAVLIERKRKGLDAGEAVEPESAEEEDLPDSQVAETKEWVSALAEKQKVLILGGSARPQVAEKLKQLLRCADVAWIDSKKGDRMSKFKVDIARADMVVIVKKFASHEMTEKGRDWAKEYGKRFVLLPSGYGVNQIIYQMYLQLVQTDIGKKVDISLPKSGAANLANLNLSMG